MCCKTEHCGPLAKRNKLNPSAYICGGSARDRCQKQREGTMPTLELEKSVTFQNIVVATDFSSASQRAFEYAANIAGDNDAQLYVLHAEERRVGKEGRSR